jgi:protease-4
MVSEISKSRKITAVKLNEYADEMLMFQPTEKSKQYALVDSLVYADQVDSIIGKYVQNFKIISHSDMCNVPDGAKFEKDKVGIIYAIGGIDSGDSEGIDSEKLVKTINEVAKDSSVKAVVLRVSSPGGSAYGSEQIWRALSLLKAKKPLIVSMGDYAASGGYYISCMADNIVAQPNTITGSIGIFGLIPNIEGLNNKLGFSYDGVKTNKMSDAISINRKFTPEERDLMQNYVNRGYELFVKRCAEGRKQTNEQIKAIAEGRVWTGEDALKIGLVDKIGGIDLALKLAIKKAKLKSYMVKEYPFKEDFISKMIKDFDSSMETRILKSQLGSDYKLLKKAQELKQVNGIQARMPYEFEIK